MEKHLKKLWLFSAILAILLNIFSPLTVFADGEPSISVTFQGGTINGNTITYTIDTTDVTVTVDNSYTLDNNGTLIIDSNNFLGALSVQNFDPNSMNIKIYSNDGFQDNIIYNNGNLSRQGTGGYPNAINFTIEKKNSDNPSGGSTVIQFPENATISENTITFTLKDNNNSNTQVTATVSGATISNNQLETNDLKNVKLALDNNFNKDTMVVRVTESNPPDPMAAYSSTLPINDLNEATFEGMNLPANVILSVEYGSADPQPTPFDGTTWFVWEGPQGEFCKYQITGIEPATDEIDANGRMARVYPTKYVKQSDVVSNATTLDLATLTNYYFVNNTWYWADGHNIAIDSITTWDEFTTYIDSVIGDDYDKLREFAYDPCGAKNGNNSISTNGDRAFRATIYDDTSYYGISNASNANDLTYFPSFWDSTFFNPAIDISATSLSNPAVIETYLLEPKIVLTSDDISAAIDNIEIASDVPNTVANITNNNGKWEIVFNSNYYDKVVFKVTSGYNQYYVMLARITIMSDGTDVGVLVPTIDINDYDVMATYYFADGTKENFLLEYSNQGDGGVNITRKNYKLSSTDAGKIDLSPTSTNGPIGVSYTVMNSGSTTTSYNGTLSGSGNGTYFNIDHGNAIVDYTK